MWESDSTTAFTNWVSSAVNHGAGSCSSCHTVQWKALFQIGPRYAIERCNACGGVGDSDDCILAPLQNLKDRCSNHTTRDGCSSTMECNWIVAFNTTAACLPKPEVRLTATHIPLEANTYTTQIPLENILDNLTSSNIVTFPGNLPGFEEGCAEGYTGFLCSNCKEGWTHSGTECQRCPENPVLSYIQLTLAVIFSLGLIAWMVRAALNYSQENANQVSILSKILVSYLQMTAVVTSFKVGHALDALECQHNA